MATVADKAGVGTLDKPLTSPNRRLSGSPVGALTPQYSGEIIHDTSNNVFWQAQGITDADWVQGVRVL